MTRTTRLSLLLGVLVCALCCMACAATMSLAHHYERMQQWVGIDVNILIQVYGPPSDVYVMPNGNKMYSWLKTNDTVVTTNYDYWRNQVVSGQVTNWCKKTWTTDAWNIVRSATSDGNACEEYGMSKEERRSWDSIVRK
jgi:hypothetical protein